MSLNRLGGIRLEYIRVYIPSLVSLLAKETVIKHAVR